MVEQYLHHRSGIPKRKPLLIPSEFERDVHLPGECVPTANLEINVKSKIPRDFPKQYGQHPVEVASQPKKVPTLVHHRSLQNFTAGLDEIRQKLTPSLQNISSLSVKQSETAKLNSDTPTLDKQSGTFVTEFKSLFKALWKCSADMYLLIPHQVLILCTKIFLTFLITGAVLHILRVHAIPHIKLSALKVVCDMLPFSDYFVDGCKDVLDLNSGSAIVARSQEESALDVIHKLGEMSTKSAEYAELLVKTDLPPAVALSLSKLAVEDLAIAVEFSDLNYKDILAQNLHEMLDYTEIIFEKISSLAASARSTVDILYNYVNIVVKTIENTQVVYNHDKLAKQYDFVITNIDEQIESLHIEAADTNQSLRDVKEKLRSIDKILHTEKQVQSQMEDETLPYLWSAVFKLKEKRKFKKNFELLNVMEEHLRCAKANIATMIGHLIDFRNDLTQLKRQTGRAQWAMQISLEFHVQILKNSLDRLKQSKDDISLKKQTQELSSNAFEITEE